MRGRRVHHACTGIGRHVFTTDDRYFLFIERMTQQDMFQRGAGTLAQHLPLQIVAGQRTGGQICSQDQVAFCRADQRIFNGGMHTHRFVSRQCPRGGRPDHGKSRAIQMIQPECPGDIDRMIRMHLKGHVNGRRVLVFVLHFGFG